MSEEVHTFHVSSRWTGDSGGDGVLQADGLSLDYGRPVQSGGRPGRTNPEDLLLSSLASCYSITFAILAERKRLAVGRIDVECTGEVVRQLGGTLKFVSIAIRPRISLSDITQSSSAEDAAHKAEQYCLISNAIRGNIEVTVEPEIVAA